MSPVDQPEPSDQLSNFGPPIDELQNAPSQPQSESQEITISDSDIVGPLYRPTEIPRQPPQIEDVRWRLALIFSLIFAFTVVVTLIGAGVYMWLIGTNRVNGAAADRGWLAFKDLLQILLPAQTALIGAVVGFYFGTQSTKATTSSYTRSSRSNVRGRS